MKKMNKKGFTIVELVIVIAVIAILAGVMIPTFGGIVKTAEKSNELQRATAAYKEAYGVAISDGKISGTETHTYNGTESADWEKVEASGYTFYFKSSNTIDANALTVDVDGIDDDSWSITVTAGVLNVEDIRS